MREAQAKKFDELHTQGFLMLSSEESAFESFWGWQKGAIAVTVALLVTFVVLWTIATLVFLNAVATLYYLSIMAFRFYTIQRSERRIGTVLNISSDEVASLQEDELPVYTILSPLYREPETIVQFNLKGVGQVHGRCQAKGQKALHRYLRTQTIAVRGPVTAICASIA